MKSALSVKACGLHGGLPLGGQLKGHVLYQDLTSLLTMCWKMRISSPPENDSELPGKTLTFGCFRGLTRGWMVPQCVGAAHSCSEALLGCYACMHFAEC